MKISVDSGVAVPFEDRIFMGAGVGDGVGEVIGEGLGVGPGVGAGVACCDTFQSHGWEQVPFSFVATADTLHVPTEGLVFV